MTEFVDKVFKVILNVKGGVTGMDPKLIREKGRTQTSKERSLHEVREDKAVTYKPRIETSKETNPAPFVKLGLPVSRTAKE